MAIDTGRLCVESPSTVQIDLLLRICFIRLKAQTGTALLGWQFRGPVHLGAGPRAFQQVTAKSTASLRLLAFEFAISEGHQKANHWGRLESLRTLRYKDDADLQSVSPRTKAARWKGAQTYYG